jgi:hypothetical protein
MQPESLESKAIFFYGQQMKTIAPAPSSTKITLLVLQFSELGKTPLMHNFYSIYTSMGQLQAVVLALLLLLL